MTDLTPGWLAERLKEIPARVALNRDPEEVAHLNIDGQLTEPEAEMLRGMMAERFFKWTGRSLLNQEKEG